MGGGTYIPPQNFGMVEADLYRSAQPTELSFPFLEKLHLRTVVYLAPDEPPQALLTWLTEQSVSLVRLDEGVGKRSPWKPISEETVLEGLNLLLDPARYPVLVMCNLGRHRTGTMIGCLRKLQGWNLTSILEEYRRHAGSKHRLLNEQFVELFDTDLISLPQRRPPWLPVAATAPAAEAAEAHAAEAAQPSSAT
jgi:tyrosine-protein phosphatase OCA1